MILVELSIYYHDILTILFLWILHFIQFQAALRGALSMEHMVILRVLTLLHQYYYILNFLLKPLVKHNTVITYDVYFVRNKYTSTNRHCFILQTEYKYMYSNIKIYVWVFNPKVVLIRYSFLLFLTYL